MTFTPITPAERRTRRMRHHLPDKVRGLSAAMAYYISAAVLSPQEIADFQAEWAAVMADTAHRHQVRILPPGPRTPLRPSQRRTRRMRDHARRSLGKSGR